MWPSLTHITKDLFRLLKSLKSALGENSLRLPGVQLSSDEFQVGARQWNFYNKCRPWNGTNEETHEIFVRKPV